jgi:chloramphenicol 3-O phosphotransferase
MILLVIGTSSTGKTTLGRALQKNLPTYWQYMGLDIFFAGMPQQYGGGLNGPLSAVGFSYEQKETDAKISYGEIGEKVLQGMISSAIAFSMKGIDLIFDDMIIDEGHASIWKEALIGHESIVVHLSASTDILARRNDARKNPPRLALNHVEMNKLIPADILLDTGLLTAEECLAKIREYVQSKTSSSRSKIA